MDQHYGFTHSFFLIYLQAETEEQSVEWTTLLMNVIGQELSTANANPSGSGMGMQHGRSNNSQDEQVERYRSIISYYHIFPLVWFIFQLCHSIHSTVHWIRSAKLARKIQFALIAGQKVIIILPLFIFPKRSYLFIMSFINHIHIEPEWASINLGVVLCIECR